MNIETELDVSEGVLELMKQHISILGEEISAVLPILGRFSKVLSFSKQPFWNKSWKSAFT